VATQHGERFRYMKEVYLLFAELQEEMTQHMLKEEQLLFPRIRQLEAVVVPNEPLAYYISPISIMEEEHNRAGEGMRRIRELTNNYFMPEGACTTFRLSLASLKAFEADLHQHVHLENYILFPRAVELFRNKREQDL
jgi:regulator of cell morphogenesis and NO signaling